MMATASLLLYACLAAGSVNSYGNLEALGGRSECAAIIGNGALTIAIDEKGKQTTMLWPSPTGPGQIWADPSHTSPWPHGTVWAVRTNGKIIARQDEWTVEQPAHRDAHGIVTTRLAYGEVHANLMQFVVPDSDVLVMRLTLESAPGDTQVFWHADFDPTTRAIPELPWLHTVATAQRDFAMFVTDSGDTVLHFRPEAPGSYDWIEAERIRDKEAPRENWDSFKDGSWLAYTPLGPGPSFACADTDDAGSLHEQLARGKIQGAQSAVGDCSVLAELQPDTPGTSQWTVLVALAKTRKEALEIARAARTKGFDALRDETAAFWDARAAKWAIPQSASEEVRGHCAQALSTITISMDKETNAIARAPRNEPPLAMDIVRHGVWSSVALNWAGEHDLSDRHSQFYAKSVRKKAKPGAPIGSIPMALLSDSSDALPHLCLDVEATGWFLWSVNQHQLTLVENPKRVFLDRLWEATDVSATFLTDWFRDPFVTPPYGFNPAQLRDTPSAELAISAYLGLKSALEIANILGMPRPDWKMRQGELEDLVRSYVTGDDGAWLLDAPLSLGLTGLVADGDARWQSRMEDALIRIDVMPTPEAAKTLCFIAWTWRNSPERLATIRPLIEPVFRRISEEYPADSYYASLMFIAAKLTFDTPPR